MLPSGWRAAQVGRRYPSRSTKTIQTARPSHGQRAVTVAQTRAAVYTSIKRVLKTQTVRIMGVGRTTQVTVGSDAFSVSTKLRTGDRPIIETLVSNQGQVVFRAALSVEDLKPIFAHSEEIARRVEGQHAAVLGDLRAKRMTSREASVAVSTSRTPARLQLERALSRLGHRDFQRAEEELRKLLLMEPGYGEAKELLEVVQAAGSQKAPPVTSISHRLRAGAEALTRGWKSSAIQNWARGLSADPSNRIFQLLVLLATTPSSERRSDYLQELFGIGQRLLSGDRSEEAHALLLALQAIEDPQGVSPQLSGVSLGPSLSSDPTTRGRLKPTDTQPTRLAPPDETLLDGMPALLSSLPLEDEPAERGQNAENAEQDEHPERRAALVEASRAESEAARKAPLRPPGTSKAYLSKGGIWERLGVPAAAGYAGIGALVLMVAGLLVFLKPAAEKGSEELENAARLVAAGRFEQAVATYDRILESGKSEAVAYLGRGRARLAAGESELGLADLSRAAELAPESAEILEETADGFYTRGRFDEAAVFYARTIGLGRDSANTRYRLAVSLVQLSRAEEAIPHLEAALGIEAAHGEARYLYGKLLNDMGRFAEAENEIRGARTRFDPGADYFVELGIALLEQGKLDAAEELARKLGRHDPRDARAHTLLGEVYLARKRFEASRQELITALQTNAEQPRAQLALARVWLAIGESGNDPGDLAKAKQILEESRGIPEGTRLLTLGEVSLVEGDTFNAINYLESALAHGCHGLPARLSLAEARFAAGDLNGAAEELQAADLLAPTDAAIPLSLGVIHSQRQDFPRASQEYLRALHRVGLTKPVEDDSGPVVLPAPYLELPARFDVNRVIQDAYRRVLARDKENAVAGTLQQIAESTSFVIAGPA